ncbi:MAG: hypothetical protein ISR96_04320 [Nitrospira sp.]|nr:hypothetical protein [bacterium]MBL7048730.1 hypothetical protein [Nitrospira sp.]
MPSVKIETISYGGWNNCVSISNGISDLIITTDIGPRIIRYGFCHRENELCEIPLDMGCTGGDEWRIYGGHRLWHSPEDAHRTYEPDNFPVKWQPLENGIRTIQNMEQRTSIIKEMDISLATEGSEVTVVHRLKNSGTWPVKLSVWALSAMAAGGLEVIPQATDDTGLLPNRTLALWPYTRLNDPRLVFGEKYILVRQDPSMKNPLKLGISNNMGWAAYFNNNHLFLKKYKHQMDEEYPDFGVSYETYTSDFMLEMESLSPKTTLQPGESASHTEHWTLFDNVVMPGEDETKISNLLKSLTGLQ